MAQPGAGAYNVPSSIGGQADKAAVVRWQCGYGWR